MKLNGMKCENGSKGKMDRSFVYIGMIKTQSFMLIFFLLLFVSLLSSSQSSRFIFIAVISHTFWTTLVCARWTFSFHFPFITIFYAHGIYFRCGKAGQFFIVIVSSLRKKKFARVEASWYLKYVRCDGVAHVNAMSSPTKYINYSMYNITLTQCVTHWK